MKKILMIRGISAYDVLGRAADEICEGFRKCGYQVDMIGATEPGADDRFIECLEHRDQYAFYFSIQAIRYAGSFHVNYEISPETASFLVPKLILQPLAENSVLHGSYNDGTVMEIYVTSRFEGSDIVLEIKDEGKGFDPSKKAAQSKGLGGIGTRNVNDRIHLYFSEQYGLTVQSQPEKGTCCRILIPAIPSSQTVPPYTHTN